jgi:metallo-beta-lactamase class B
MARQVVKPGILIALFCAFPLFGQDPNIRTPRDLFQRNIGTKEQQMTPFTPFRIAGNLYYVGTGALASFLVSTPEGLILINSDYEANVPGLKESVEKLGFKFTDIRLILGSHAHGDHMEGDALAKELSGASVVAMEADVAALQKITPGNKPHPIDRVIHDGDTVTLGGTTLTAHLTPGHTRGCTTWTMKAVEAGKSYNVVIIGSAGVNPGVKLVNNADYPQIADDFRRTFKVLYALPCDIPLGSHPAMFGLAGKYPRLSQPSNPFVDPAGYRNEIATVEQVFKNELAAQQAAEK